MISRRCVFVARGLVSEKLPISRETEREDRSIARRRLYACMYNAIDRHFDNNYLLAICRASRSIDNALTINSEKSSRLA